MEELQEADVLWPDTPDTPDRGSCPPELCEAAAVDFSCESFGSDDDDPAASSSSTSSASSSVLPFGRGGSSGGFLSDPSTSSFAGGRGGDGVEEEFQEADVLWPDDGYPTRERAGADGGELWWLCCLEPAAAGQRQAWRPLVSSPIDIPNGVAAAAARRRCPGGALVHRRSRRMD